ncbi:WbqC-like protein family protein [Spirosomataceae bacterium TFI 002]|nr:WbqC-like protein family protein [Spirosomataceae bacterium TFI 002]
MILTPHFLPCVRYCIEILKFENVELDVNQTYTKQSYRNRAYILGANKVEALIIPVHASSGKTLMKDVRVDNHSLWQKNQWKTIEAAYRKAPFYEHYDYLFQPSFEKKYNFLNDFLVDNLTSCLTALNVNKTLCLVENSQKELNFDLNAKERVKRDPDYQLYEYYQNFGNVFEPNLSILDMIFCIGPESRSHLEKSLLG